MRLPRYRQIAEDVKKNIEDGYYPRGQLLPSEASFSREYEVSRVTIRKALEVLKDSGIVAPRHGAGWLVTTPPVKQSLGSFLTLEEQLSNVGIRPSRKVLSSRRVHAQGRRKEVLGDEELLEVERLNLADGLPFARITVWLGLELAKQFSMSDLEERSFYDLLTESSRLVSPLSSAVQTISAVLIDKRDAQLLEVPEGSPAFRCERVTFDSNGVPILLSEFVFPGSRTEFISEMVSSNQAILPPTGLRLIQG